MQQKYCEKCGLDYHNVLAMNCKNDSPAIGSPMWRNGRWQVMQNIYNRQSKLRNHIVKTEGEMVLREMQKKSTEILNQATYGLTQDSGWE